MPTVQRGGRPVRVRERGDVPVRRQPEGVLQREAVPDLQQQIGIPDLRVGGDVGMELAAQGALGQGLLKERLLGQEPSTNTCSAGLNCRSAKRKVP